MAVIKSKFLSAAFVGVLCCAVGVGFVATTLGTAYAAAAQGQQQGTGLSAVQIAAIQAQIKAAIDAANMKQFDAMMVDPQVQAICNCAMQDAANNLLRMCDNPARIAALAQAIADVTVTLVKNYDPKFAGEIASIILSVAMNSGVPSTAIGVGLGKGAQQVAQSDTMAATFIAQEIANEGTVDIANCFASAVGSQQLASIALGPPSTTGAGAGGPGAPGNGSPGVNPVLAVSPS